MPIVTRTVGTCPICVAQFKVRGERLVHHGYQRPGWGYIVGDCFGVGWAPYELSADVCKAWQDRLRVMIHDTMDLISALDRREPETLSETVGHSRPVTYTYRRDSEEPSPNKTRYAGDPWDKTENDDYERIRRGQIGQSRMRLKAMKADSERMGQLIKDWAPAPLIEIDEEGFTPAVKRERDERRAKKEAEKAERERKWAAQREKMDQRAAAKEAQFREFKRQLEVLASWPPSANRDLQARRLNGAMFRFYKGLSIASKAIGREEQLEIERLLEAVGLGRPWHDQWGRRFDYYSHLVERGKPQID